MTNPTYSVKLDLISSEASDIFRLITDGAIAGLITLFGIASNIINMIVFRKQGFTTTVNISFFALALSDVFCLVTYEWYNIFMNPYMDRDPIPLAPEEFQYLTGGWFHVCFGRITSWITVYITAERCLSVALPLKVKQIVSVRKTKISMCTIFAVNLLTLIPEYSIAYLDWKFVPERNRTLIGLVYRSFKKEADGLVYTLSSIIGMSAFIAVILLTTLLTFKLTQKSNWHIKSSANNAQSEARSLRDKKTMKMVVMIATILIVCYTPATVASLVTVFEPEFILAGKNHNIFFDIWSFAFLCSAINSSVNMFLYYNMSTKYRDTFDELFLKCKKRSLSI